MKFKEIYNRIIDGTPIYVGDETKEECELIYMGEKENMPAESVIEIKDEEVMDITMDPAAKSLVIWIVREK